MERDVLEIPRRRADARRNIDAILEAGRQCLSRDPEASVNEIAAAAGVGRVTLYGHFPNRATLIATVVTRALDEFDAALDAVDLTGDPRDALGRLVEAIWRPTAESALLVVAAERSLTNEEILAAHQRPMQRLTAFIERGRDKLAFRRDLPTSWLVAVFHSIVHAAANEVAAGRLPAGDASAAIGTTVLAAFTPTPDRPARREPVTARAAQRGECDTARRATASPATGGVVAPPLGSRSS
jgi:TetR/AcrR family transcriptional repressor of mexCD-oprJ operon